MTIDIREDDLTLEAPAADRSDVPIQSPLDYSAPRLVSLGKVSTLIQGYWDEGYADYGARYKHNGDN